ncbi:MAG: hypothetical protein FWC41_07645 [Firmicutes bacterium]|nr:hypothetical protein [Bacillota bacterium]
MQNITKNSGCVYMPGNRKIFITPTEEVNSVNLINEKTKYVIFKVGGSWGEIEAKNIQFKNPFEDGIYKFDISCRLPSAKGAYDILFNNMTAKRWLVKIIDNNNQLWLAGCLDEPLRFRWAHIAEADPSGLHGYELFFERESSMPLFLTL